jgi:hypothetical protein
VIPAALIQEVYEKTKEVARGTAETLIARRVKAIEYFKSVNVSEIQICEALDVKKIEDIDLDKLSILSGMRSLIKNGEGTVSELFKAQEPKTNEEKIKDVELQKEKIKNKQNKIDLP